MTGRWRHVLAGASAAALLALLLWTERSGNLPSANSKVLAADGTLRWFKGNLHTHTLWSDGDDYPEMVALWYKDRGYDFLSFSDHNTLLNRERWIDALKNKGGRIALEKLKARFPDGWVQERRGERGNTEVRLKTMEEIVKKVGSPGSFLLMQGEEISDHFRWTPVHLNVTNVEEAIPPMGGDSVYDVMQRNTDALVAQRERTGRPMLIHLNHPNFHYGIVAEDLSLVRGENFFEVYNGHPEVHNDGNREHASAERIWDIILTRRITRFRMPLMYCLATDDGHNYHTIPSRESEPGRGWVVVLARELSAAAIIEAMERGSFYASTGVKLERVTSAPRAIEVCVEPQEGVSYVIDFIGTRTGFDPGSEPVLDSGGKPLRTTRRYSNDIGRVLETHTGARATYTFDDDDLYVRARVTSTRKHPNPSTPGEYERAWCQPVLGPAARDR
jgi:hypothetical protein